MCARMGESTRVRLCPSLYARDVCHSVDNALLDLPMLGKIEASSLLSTPSGRRDIRLSRVNAWKY
jgi:hypothetical protein